MYLQHLCWRCFDLCHEIQKEITFFFKIQFWPFSLTYPVLWHSAWQWIISLQDPACGLGQSQAQITPQKAIGSVKHDFPFIDPCWLFLATSLSLMCFQMVSSSIYSIIFPGIEVRLAGLLFPGPFFLPSLKTGGAFTFFQCLSTSPDHNKILKTIKNGTRLTSASSHSTCRCTPAGSMYLYVSGSRGRASALKLLPRGEVSL